MSEALGADSTAIQFEAAANAIVAGEAAAVAELIRANPELIRARSSRSHRSTLLHYVSANGVEDFRQKTPANVVEITRLLLDAGADINAESDAYAGRETTLALTATSCHPENAGVQIPLMELLIARGAIIERPDGPGMVNYCLRNGRGEAARFLAARGARLDLEGAAGVGQLDIVRGLVPATNEQMKSAFAWACEFGRAGVVEFFLDADMDVSAPLPHHGQTGLHWAACCGEIDTVRLLLRRHAPVDAKDKTHGATPLSWTLHAWRNWRRKEAPWRHYRIAALLVAAGAIVEPEWLTGADIRADPDMLAALNGANPQD